MWVWAGEACGLVKSCNFVDFLNNIGVLHSKYWIIIIYTDLNSVIAYLYLLYGTNKLYFGVIP